MTKPTNAVQTAASLGGCVCASCTCKNCQC